MNITTKSDYDEYVKYFHENDLETFYRDYETLNSNLKASQFAIEFIMPEEMFNVVLMSTIKKLKAINLISDIKDIACYGIDAQQMNLLNIINDLNPVEIESVYKLMAKAFMTTINLVEIRIKQLYSENLAIKNIRMKTKKNELKGEI